MFQSRPSREGFCKHRFRHRRGHGRCFNPVQAGKGSARRHAHRLCCRQSGVSIPSKPGRVLQAGCQGQGALPDLPFQSRPSREGFCKSGTGSCLSCSACFNPVQAGKGSARRPRRTPMARRRLRSFNPVQAGKGSASGGPHRAPRRHPSFNPVQAGKGSARAKVDLGGGIVRVFQSRPSREGFCKRGQRIGPRW